MLDKQNITYAELEAQFGIKRATAYALVSQKRIPHIRLGRRFVLFPVKAVTAWFQDHHVEVQARAR